MIGKDEIARASADADALADEHNDLPGYWRQRGVDIDGLSYVAMERGLRGILMLRGENPNQGDRPTAVRISHEEARLQTLFASMFMAGFAVRDRLKVD